MVVDWISGWFSGLSWVVELSRWRGFPYVSTMFSMSSLSGRPLES
jgi:hypothetical protein